jgi:hypothetical protein
MSLDDRLRNWAWYVSGSVIPQPDSTCRSFEKNYIPELGNLYAPEEPTTSLTTKMVSLLKKQLRVYP